MSNKCNTCIHGEEPYGMEVPCKSCSQNPLIDLFIDHWENKKPDNEKTKRLKEKIEKELINLDKRYSMVPIKEIIKVLKFALPENTNILKSIDI